MTNQYTGKERVMAACKGEKTDRAPMMVHVPMAHKFAGYTRQECLLDPDKALQAQIKAYEIFPSDMLGVHGDPFLPTNEQATYQDKHGEGTRPKHYLEDKARLGELKASGPKLTRRYAKYMEMCYKTQKAFPEAWIAALVGGPWTVAVTLRGIEALIFDAIDEPEWVHDLMRIACEFVKIRGDAIIETGVALLIAEAPASSGVISPSMYTEFVNPYVKNVFTHFRQQGALIDFHVCGYTDPILENTTSLDIDILDIDGPTSLEKTVKTAQGKVAIRGNISSELFRDGTKEEIEKTVNKSLELAAAGGNYILAPGCGIPEDTPLENIKYFWEAGLKYGRYN